MLLSLPAHRKCKGKARNQGLGGKLIFLRVFVFVKRVVGEGGIS